MQTRTASGISNQDQLNKSFDQVVNGNLEFGYPQTFDNTGTPLTYAQANLSGCIIRVGSSSNPDGLPNFWTATDTPVVIPHNLGKIPYGYIVISQGSGAAGVFAIVYWETNLFPPTTTTITLYISNAQVDTTIFLIA